MGAELLQGAQTTALLAVFLIAGVASAQEVPPPAEPEVPVPEVPVPGEAAAEPEIPVPGEEPRAEPPKAEPPKAEPKEIPRRPRDGVLNRSPDWFYKGDLAAVGALGLVPWENRVGARLGVQRLGEVFYIAITPTVNYTIPDLDSPLLLSFGVPLRFELLDTRGQSSETRFANLGRFRVEDWNSVEDYAKLIRYITYGRKEGKFYANLSAFRTGTIGHGTILNRHNPNLSIDVTRVSLELDAFSDWVGAETYLNSIAPPNLIGGLVFVKPLSFIDRSNYLLRSFSIGFTMVADINAPVVNKLDTRDADSDGRRNELLLGGENDRVRSFEEPLLAYGVDVELKVYKSPDKTYDLKVYTDLSFLSGHVPKDCDQWADPEQAVRCANSLFTNDTVTLGEQPTELETDSVTSMGGTIGLLGRFTLGDTRDHAVRTRFEARLYEPNYVPGYFDTLYQIQRVQYANSADPSSQNPANSTKQRRILERRGDGIVFAGYAEASYRYAKLFEAALGIGMSTLTHDSVLLLHVGVPQWKWLQFHASFQKTASAPADLFTSTRNSVFILEARAQIAPFLHLNVEALTPFGFGEDNRFEQLFDVNAVLELSFGI
ncbi:MAG: hypothetical protein ACI9WU_002843 [Myxococcota bacterium]|jgi:hypothetical protein